MQDFEATWTIFEHASSSIDGTDSTEFNTFEEAMLLLCHKPKETQD
jgi:hypothetical protein